MATEIGRPTTNSLMAAIHRALSRVTAIDGVRSTFITSRDGLLVAGDGDAHESLEMKAALAAALFGAVDRTTPNLELGPARTTLVETASHYMQILSLAGLLLVATAQKSANPSKIRAEMIRAGEELARASAKS